MGSSGLLVEQSTTIEMPTRVAGSEAGSFRSPCAGVHCQNAALSDPSDAALALTYSHRHCCGSPLAEEVRGRQTRAHEAPHVVTLIEGLADNLKNRRSCLSAHVFPRSQAPVGS